MIEKIDTVRLLVAIKHLPGRHNQQTHDPTKGTVTLAARGGKYPIAEGEYSVIASGTDKYPVMTQMMKAAGVKTYKEAHVAGFRTVKVGDQYHVIDTNKAGQPSTAPKPRHEKKDAKVASRPIADQVGIHKYGDVAAIADGWTKEVLSQIPEKHLLDAKGNSMLGNVFVVAGHSTETIPYHAPLYKSYLRKKYAASGLADQKRGDVYVTDRKGRGSNYRGYKKTLIHEIGHVVFSERVVANIPGNRGTLDKLKKVPLAERKATSWYARSKKTEYYAEAYAQYSVDPRGLKKRAPQTYAIMDEFFKE